MSGTEYRIERYSERYFQVRPVPPVPVLTRYRIAVPDHKERGISIMPATSADPIIRHVWRPRHDRAYIHYLAVSGAEEVHLRAAASDPIYPVLDDALTRMGYPDTSYPGRVDGSVPPLTEAAMSWWRAFVHQLAGWSRSRGKRSTER